jgi:two-component system sensor histidine kinase UhpB
MPKKTNAHLSARNKPSLARIAPRKRTKAKPTKQSKETKKLRNAPLGAEERLRKSEERFAAFMDNLPGYAWLKDLQGRYVYVNQAVRELPGYQSLGKTDAQIWPADVAATYRANDQQVIAAKKPLHTIEHFLHEGKQRCLVGSKFPIFDKAGAVALVGGAAVDITERIEAESALRESTDRLQHLSRRLLAVQEEERRHLSRELHDEFGQLLATISIHLHAAKGLAGDAARSRLEEASVLLQRTGAQVRSLAFELRPTMLELSGLGPTLMWLAEQHQQRTGIAIRVVGQLNDVPGDLAMVCFRAAQEGLTNVVRHARAQHVWIELSQTDGALELVVRDDGVGFDVTSTLDGAANRGHLGLLGMKERVQILGGNLEVDSEPGHGTRIRISLPLAAGDRQERGGE